MKNGIGNIDCQVDKTLNKIWLQEKLNSLQHIAACAIRTTISVNI
jgi:hypothetical protein